MQVTIRIDAQWSEISIEEQTLVPVCGRDPHGINGSATNFAVAINRALAAVLEVFNDKEKTEFLAVFNHTLRDRPSAQNYHKYIDAAGRRVQDRGLGMWAMQHEYAWQFGTAEQIGVAFPVTPDPENGLPNG